MDMTIPVQIPPSFDHAVALLAAIAGTTEPLEVSEDTQLVVHQLVADLFGRPLEEVSWAVEYAVEQNARFRVEACKVKIEVEFRAYERIWVELGTVDEAAKTAVLGDTYYINRSEQFRSDIIGSTEIDDCRAWLETKGYSVTES